MKTETLAANALAKDLELKAVFEIEQNGRKQTLIVKKDRMVIGTVESADVKLVGTTVAPVHAFIELKYGSELQSCSARLIDLASPGGVTVNGKKIINDLIQSGDRIQVGDAIFKFSFVKPEFQNPLPDRALLLIDASEVKTIFDYRPPVKEALEVVYSWKSVILDVKHFVDHANVTLGGTDSDDFLVPSVFSNGSVHQLASKSGRDWTVFIDSKMTGVLYLKGQLFSIEDYRREKMGSDARGAVTLGENDFIKIEAGGIAFYLSQTVAPPIMRSQTNLMGDPFLTKSLLTSVFVTALLLIGVANMEVKPIEQPVPEVLATILYHPEKYSIKHRIPPPEKRAEAPKEVATPAPKKAEIDFTKPKDKQGKVASVKSPQPGKKASGQNQAKEGAGARAKGEEGSRGAKNAQTSATKQTAANRPSPQAGVGRGGTTSQTQDNGNVQMLKGATNKILDLLGGSGEKLGKSGAKLSGFGGFSTQGNGGLALSGQGKGGGGNADTLLGGTSDHGRGGGKVGTGLGAEGTGSGIVGGRTRVELNVGGGDETVVVGAIDRDAIDAAIRAHRDELRYCYEKAVNQGSPDLAGKIVSAFVIGGSGRASQLAIASSSIHDASVERCVLQVLARIQFPQPAGGVPVTIKYPFAFTNASK
ncbi:MAG: AgmX/PglI C-terminal domain-containing protein [Bdellovibrionales bacterium]|nr:AgmX/PglI C-terminal domain-containing protein [Oligoflexia bacterium]